MSRLRQVSLAWLRASEWPQWLQLDGSFQPDHKRWLARMEAAEAQLRAKGIATVRVDVSVAEFRAWAAATGRACDSDSRATFAVLKSRALDDEVERQA